MCYLLRSLASIYKGVVNRSCLKLMPNVHVQFMSNCTFVLLFWNLAFGIKRNKVDILTSKSSIHNQFVDGAAKNNILADPEQYPII
jgi:hypothetical protein